MYKEYTWIPGKPLGLHCDGLKFNLRHKIQTNCMWIAEFRKDQCWARVYLACTPMTCQTAFHREHYTCTLMTPLNLLYRNNCGRGNALDERNKCCVANSLTPHPEKCEALLLYRGSFIGPYPLITIGKAEISWVGRARLLGITIDHKLTWAKHLTDLKYSFVTKPIKFAKKLLFSNKKITSGFIF